MNYGKNTSCIPVKMRVIYMKNCKCKKKKSRKGRNKKNKQERRILFVNIKFIQRKLKFCGEKHNKTSLHPYPLSQVTTVQMR
jgi:hypothetical protein